ncbi:hypothetical protein CPB84DRAFT_1751804 [Gymnopilus junonius]|uniref:Uncharacterized protein n=1 Tax=Gymnopilus junonius TaxID=109634 RepID=A0A9P5TIF1_GYMJU|nr:hypothetical protein CPB84DRAFT_1751804 [Gymnopilus junonius]
MVKDYQAEEGQVEPVVITLEEQESAGGLTMIQPHARSTPFASQQLRMWKFESTPPPPHLSASSFPVTMRFSVNLSRSRWHMGKDTKSKKDKEGDINGDDVAEHEISSPSRAVTPFQRCPCEFSTTSCSGIEIIQLPPNLLKPEVQATPVATAAASACTGADAVAPRLLYSFWKGRMFNFSRRWCLSRRVMTREDVCRVAKENHGKRTGFGESIFFSRKKTVVEYYWTKKGSKNRRRTTKKRQLEGIRVAVIYWIKESSRGGKYEHDGGHDDHNNGQRKSLHKRHGKGIPSADRRS